MEPKEVNYVFDKYLKGYKPKHFIWALYFLRKYVTLHTHQINTKDTKLKSIARVRYLLPRILSATKYGT